MVTKVDSNSVGLRFAVESTIGVLPVSPVWYPIEPNEFNEFGPNYKTVARAPINASRQRRKGALVGREVPAGFGMDWLNSLYRVMPSFFFAAWREKANKTPSAVSSTLYTVASGGAGFLVKGLLFAEGFAVTGNNGLKKISANSGTTVTAPGLAVETPPATAKITLVGVEFDSADLTVATHAEGATIGCTAFDFTTLPLIPGEWFFIGGDSAGTKFATAADNGWYRVKTIAATAIVCDRVPGTIVNDSGTGKTVRMFFGHVIKNENDPDLIVRQTLQFERAFDPSLDNEYLIGQVANELSLDIKTEDKVTVGLTFMGLTSEEAAEKSGSRPDVTSEAAYTASNDFSRIRLQREDTDATLATYMDSLKLTIKNNCKYNKAIGTLGAWEITTGTFEVMGEASAFFSSFAAAAAIRENADVSLDFAMVQLNAGWFFDLPLVTLGDARADVKKDEPVMLPLKQEASAHATLQHTLLCQYFPYLPDLAE